VLVHSGEVVKLGHVSLGLVEHNKESKQGRDSQDEAHAHEAKNFANNVAVVTQEIAIGVTSMHIFSWEPRSIIMTFTIESLTLVITITHKLASNGAESMFKVRGLCTCRTHININCVKTAAMLTLSLAVTTVSMLTLSLAVTTVFMLTLSLAVTTVFMLTSLARMLILTLFVVLRICFFIHSQGHPLEVVLP